MSPGGRRGRHYGSSEEGRLRDLSPDTTLCAFTQRPMPFDTARDEYKIFSCIDTLTAAERDLGARVAKAAQRLKSWCSEIEQWGWSGSFEQPSVEYREKRRRSLELRIREHVGDADLTNTLPPLEYWGSLLSVEVESHEARLDDIEEEMLKLDVEELKEHVLDMHPSGRSRPSSAGFEASRQNYKPMDDFSFLITQTLLSALPHHAQLKDRLSTWTARISTLREVPRYTDDLTTAQTAMRLGWHAIDPPTNNSDAAFLQWKEAVDTISHVLGAKVSDLGKRLDMMLDTLEGRDDCIPDRWIDDFEGIEADYGKWTHESRRKVIDFDVRRKWVQRADARPTTDATNEPESHTNHGPVAQPIVPKVTTVPIENVTAINTEQPLKSEVVAEILSGDNDISTLESEELRATADTAKEPIHAPEIEAPAESGTHLDFTEEHLSQALDSGMVPRLLKSYVQPASPIASPRMETRDVFDHNVAFSPTSTTPKKKPWFIAEASPVLASKGNGESLSAIDETVRVQDASQTFTDTGANPVSIAQISEETSPTLDEESEFEEGDTMIHNELDESPEAVPVRAVSDPIVKDCDKTDAQTNDVRFRRKPANLSDNPTIITNDGLGGVLEEPPQTPRSRRDSNGSISSSISFDSSPPNTIEDSPSVRNTTNRSGRQPRPELNAAMAKRRTMKSMTDHEVASAPWPPTQFSQKNSAEDLERKISDILTTIPAHIRLTSGPGPDAPEVKPRGVTAKGSRAYLRAARSISGMKSPELTLSPAKNEFDNAASGRRSATSARGDNDIKLYHLTQPGKEQPVKLFIRRVGENGERVMVRVGGGWADLGEYLRQYAEHHGRRTASDGKFEILGLEVKNSDNTNSPNRPESGLSKRDRRISGGRPTASPLTTPTKTAFLGSSNDDAVPPMPSFASTPGVADETSTPSTTSSRRSWTGHEVGLAGPQAKKMDLSGEKLEWIEGMMKQARTVSGNVITANHAPFERADSRTEARPDSRVDKKKTEFGDLGKVGGTKRIFLKGGKPVMGE
ncbi:hypothetical protein CC86DRAFT_367852 [Ophiobolus disseminans]|uniref:GAR domain-containing protein n=1 Tax=Ophiobolus disseminans TaxID=1469910 RepID=A0A6A7AB75_9PLEO|nr:hypothetical protein CC86DRAFT_367852 [Ophiobolus disseminans]